MSLPNMMRSFQDLQEEWGRFLGQCYQSRRTRNPEEWEELRKDWAARVAPSCIDPDGSTYSLSPTDFPFPVNHPKEAVDEIPVNPTDEEIVQLGGETVEDSTTQVSEETAAAILSEEPPEEDNSGGSEEIAPLHAVGDASESKPDEEEDS